jgi:hypothetical protein
MNSIDKKLKNEIEWKNWIKKLQLPLDDKNENNYVLLLTKQVRF